MVTDKLPEKRTFNHHGIDIITRLPDELAISIADEVMRSRIHLELADQLTIKILNTTRGDRLFTIVLTRENMRIVESDPE